MAPRVTLTPPPPSAPTHPPALRTHPLPVPRTKYDVSPSTTLQANAYMYATLSLFGGIFMYKGIDYVVHLIEGDVSDHNVDIDLYDLDGNSSVGNPNSPRVDAGGLAAADKTNKPSSASVSNGPGGIPTKDACTSGGANHTFPDPAKPPPRSANPTTTNAAREFPHSHDVVVEFSAGPTVRPSPDLHTLHLRMAGKVQQQHNRSHHHHQQQQQEQTSPVWGLTPTGLEAGGDKASESGQHPASAEEEGVEMAGAAPLGGEDKVAPADDDAKLVRMGLMTAVAIGIHNLPEGLATFVAALSDPSVGTALAIAIAIHNIPEGLCVAIPVYYATGNRWKAFGWALLSGVTEPIGAGLGWLILKDIMSELVYGILFGVVAGMMVNITIHELIPTAVRYDPADKVTTNSIIAGMAIMAASLALFLY